MRQGYIKKHYSKGAPGKRPRFATFDLETDGLGGEILAASWMTEDCHEPHYIHKKNGEDTLQELFYTMCENHQYIWFAHNAQYELRYFVERLENRKNDTSFYLRTDSDVFMVSLNLPEYGEKARLTIRDSFALFPAKLKRKNPQDAKGFADIFCPELCGDTIDFDNETFDPVNPAHIAYSKRDSHSLLVALQRFDDLIFEAFGVHIRTTTASTALAAWERTLEKDETYGNHKQIEDFVRSGYYGGLVFLTDTEVNEGAKTYDINSSYPYQMLTHPVPIGSGVRTTRYDPSLLGVYRVTITSPDNLIVPIIPVRDNQGIVWPSGTFETTVTNIDIDFAVTNSYKIETVHEGVVWQSSGKPFEKFISKCRKIRVEHKGTALETIAKLMQNSLYGKFASKRKRRKIYTPNELDDEDTLGACPWGEFWCRFETDEDMMCLPQWSTFITAYARRHLLNQVYNVGPENVLYGDTDSLTLRPGFELPTGSQYGDFKLEKVWDKFKARSPKVYSGIISGKYKGAIKGIPRGQWEKSGALKGVLDGSNTSVDYVTMSSFVNVLKGDEKTAYLASRRISELGNSRSWKADGEGRVRPRDWQEIVAAKSNRQRSSFSFDEPDTMERHFKLLES